MLYPLPLLPRDPRKKPLRPLTGRISVRLTDVRLISSAALVPEE
jgi:hypothetical protein